MLTRNQKGLPTFCRREEAELPGWSFPYCWASWQTLCVPPSVAVCCQRLGFVSWLLIGTFCILPVNSTVDFLICSMWLASTDRARQAKRNPMEHSTYQPFSALCACQTYSSMLGLIWCASVCVCPGHIEQPALSTLLTLEREKANFESWYHKGELLVIGGDFLRGYKPALLTAPFPAYIERHSVVSSDWVNAWKSAFVAHVFQKFQNITVSKLYQDHTWVYLPSFQDFPWKEITKSVEALNLYFYQSQMKHKNSKCFKFYSRFRSDTFLIQL